MRNRLLFTFALLGAALVLFIALPLARTLLASSPALLAQTLLEPEVRAAILLTFGASALATLLALVLGVPLAYVLARADFPGKAFVEALLDIPVVVPHSAAGIALLMVFGRQALLGRLFGHLGLRFVSAVPGIVIAMLFVSLSFLVNAARDGFRAVDERLERVARTLGASPWEVFWQVTFPLAWRSILSGVIMMWARGLSEFGAVVILAYHPMVAPVLIFERFESYGLNYARPVATLVILISLAVFLVLRWIGRPLRETAAPQPAEADPSLEEEPFLAGSVGKGPRPGVELHLRDLHLTLGAFRVQHLTLRVQPGEYFILLGPTGSGKTVLLETLAGLHHPQKGQIFFGSQEVTHAPPEARRVGFVYQDYALFPHWSVAENVAYGLALAQQPRWVRWFPWLGGRYRRQAARSAAVQSMLRLLHIAPLADRRPTHLSGGERQRTALARALVVRPRLLLLDEPLSALDPQRREALRRELRRLHAALGTTVVHVTHDFEEAVALGDRIAVLRQGRLEQVGTPEEVFRRPATPFVARFVGVRNLFAAQATDGPEGMAWLRLAGLTVAAVTDLRGPVHFTIRPEDLVLARGRLDSSLRNLFPGRVTEVDRRGALVYVTVEVGEGVPLVAAVTAPSVEALGLRPGAQVSVGFKASAVHVF